MRRFTLTQLFMATALLAICLTFVQSDGCGHRYSKIGTVAFSPDDKTIAVGRYDARDARTPGKGYLANVSRTVSLLDAETGQTNGIAERQLRRGNCGPAFGLFRYVQRAVAFNGNDCLLLREFGGGDITFKKATAHKSRDRLGTQSGNFVLSKDQSLLLSGLYDQVYLWELAERKQVATFTAEQLPFRRSPAFAISDDNSLVAIASAAGVVVRERATGATVYQTSCIGSAYDDVAFISGQQQVAVLSRESLCLVDFENDSSQPLFEGETWCMSVSPDGTSLARAGEVGVQLYHIATGRRTTYPATNRVTSMCFSSNGKLLALGDYDGRVTMLDTSTGETMWSASPPGRIRPPWTFPVAALVLWAWVYRRLSRKRAMAKNDLCLLFG